MLAGFSTFLCLYNTQPLLPFFRQLFHASEFKVSLTVSAITMGVAITAPVIGLLAEKVGRRRVIVCAAFALTVPTLLAASSPSLNAMIGWRFVQGLIIPGIIAVMIAYIGEEWADRGVGAMMSVYLCGTILGGFTGRFLSGIIASRYPWRWAFLAVGILTLACACAVWRWLPASRNFSAASSLTAAAGTFRVHLQNPRMLAIFGMGSLVLFWNVGVFTYVNFYLAAPPFNLNPAALGSIFFVYLFGLVATPLAGRFLDRSGFRRTAVLACVMGVTGLLLTLTHSLSLVLVGLAFSSSGVFISQTAASVQVGRVAGAGGKSLAAGIYVTCYYVGGSLGAIVPAKAWLVGGWPACVLMLMVATLSMLALAFASQPVCISPEIHN
jgi:predicted MFS family arabinose efflux permease